MRESGSKLDEGTVRRPPRGSWTLSRWRRRWVGCRVRLWAAVHTSLPTYVRQSHKHRPESFFSLPPCLGSARPDRSSKYSGGHIPLSCLSSFPPPSRVTLDHQCPPSFPSCRYLSDVREPQCRYLPLTVVAVAQNVARFYRSLYLSGGCNPVLPAGHRHASHLPPFLALTLTPLPTCPPCPPRLAALMCRYRCDGRLWMDGIGSDGESNLADTSFLLSRSTHTRGTRRVLWRPMRWLGAPLQVRGSPPLQPLGLLSPIY